MKNWELFPGRTESLRAIRRYHIYTPMFYRTDLVMHARRVAWLTEALAPHMLAQFGQRYDPNKAWLQALVHDDAEIITGDVQAVLKTHMSKGQLLEIEQEEERAIHILCGRAPCMVGPYHYVELLYAALRKDTLEAQLVSLADKIDAFGESMHEVFGGNLRFVTNLIHPDYGRLEIPPIGCAKALLAIPKKFPLLAFLAEAQKPLFDLDETTDWPALGRGSRPHDNASLDRPTGCPPYDFWKRVLVARGGEAERERLTQQRELAA